MFHKIDSGREEDNTRATTIYTIYGRHDFEDDSGFPRLEEDKEESNDAYAKAVTVVARQKYAERQIDKFIKWSINQKGYVKFKDVVRLHEQYNIKVNG